MRTPEASVHRQPQFSVRLSHKRTFVRKAGGFIKTSWRKKKKPLAVCQMFRGAYLVEGVMLNGLAYVFVPLDFKPLDGPAKRTRNTWSRRSTTTGSRANYKKDSLSFSFNQITYLLCSKLSTNLLKKETKSSPACPWMPDQRSDQPRNKPPDKEATYKKDSLSLNSLSNE